MKGGEERVGRIVEQLAGKDASERVVVIGEDTQVSVWNNGVGLYTWRAESVGNGLE